MILTRDRIPINFPRRNRLHPPAQDIEAQPAQTAVSGEFETYGELSIPPDRQPTRVGLDIITHILVIPGLSTKTTPNHNLSSIELDVVPRVSLDLPRPPSMTPSEQVQQYMTEAEASLAALDAGRSLVEKMKEAVHYLKAEQQGLDSSQCENAAESAAQRIKASKSVDVVGEEAVNEKAVDEMEMQDIFVMDGKEDEEKGPDEVVVDPMSFTFGSGKAMAGLYH